MNKSDYSLLEQYMLDCMKDSAHDKEHIYRVLYNALIIAKTENAVDYDVLIAACLLHDIGRKEQYENPKLCHAAVGGEKAYKFLINNGFEKAFTDKVCNCIKTHRYRKSSPPESIEAKILFDADKIEAVGAMGIARTLIYKGIVGDPLYSLTDDGAVSDGDGDKEPSFFQEYKYKLEKLYSHFYTEKGFEIAKERQQTAVDFYNGLFDEIDIAYKNGKDELERNLNYET